MNNSKIKSSIQDINGLEEALTKKEASKYLRCSESSLNRYLKKGLIRYAKLGGKKGYVKIKKEWLDNYIDECTIC